MKLTDNLPNWIAWPLRLVLYAFVLFVLFSIAMGFINSKVMGNAAECNDVISGIEPGLKHARAMVTCLRKKNGLLENWMSDSVYRAIEALPNSPAEFVGTWEASQPGCSYRHKLEANGEFVSESKGCPGKFALYSPFHGVWGVYDNKMIWLPDEGVVWPPVINPMDAVDKDFFLLVEQDGSRTKFLRVASELMIKEAVPDSKDRDGVQAAQDQTSSVATSSQESARHSDGEYAYLAESLHLEERNLTIPPGAAFDKLTVSGKEDLNKQLSSRLSEQVQNMVSKHGCETFPLDVYHKQGTDEKIIQTSCFDQKNTANEYPVTFVSTSVSIRELAEMYRYGFMYQSGVLKAVTDINNNGHLELWLEGAICECDGEDNEPCDCTGTTVVEGR